MADKRVPKEAILSLHIENARTNLALRRLIICSLTILFLLLNAGGISILIFVGLGKIVLPTQPITALVLAIFIQPALILRLAIKSSSFWRL